jgi:hypothetical protein
MTAPLGVAAALSAVMGEVLSIGKDQAVKDGPVRFKFRGVDDVMLAVGPALRKHGVIFAPSRVVSVEHERYSTAKGSPMDGVTVVVEYTITGPAGDTMTAAAAGQASDSGDKAVPKAMSVAYRTVLLQALCIPAGDPDPDSQVHERASAPPVDPRAALWAEVRQAREALGWSSDDVAADFVGWSEGSALGEADADQLTRYVQHLRAALIAKVSSA